MSNSANSPSGIIPPVALPIQKPFPGQSDKEVARWLKSKIAGGADIGRASRAYSNALKSYRPAFNEGNAVRLKWEAEQLTELQRNVLVTARASRAADPKYQAEMREKGEKEKAEEERHRIVSNAADRAAYAAKVGRPVRKYRKRDEVSDADRAADQKERTGKANDIIRSALLTGKNPYDFRDEKRAARHFVCDALLKRRPVVANDPAMIANLVTFLDQLHNLEKPSLDEAAQLLAGAVNTLRAAGVVSLKGGVASLRPEYAEISIRKEMRTVEGFGIF